MKKALTIAGSDSGGGAGIQADLKTFSALGVYGASVVTAITAQNTLGVQGIHLVPASMVALQIDSVLSDIGADAVKTGMLGDTEIVTAVAARLRHWKVRNLVVDPVMLAKSGDALLALDARDALLRHLMPLATVITPNCHEAEVLTGIRVSSRDTQREAARALCELGAAAVIVKGGHIEEDQSVDLLFDGKSFSEFRSRRVPTRNTHGTGCTFASAIAAGLAQGLDLVAAATQAKTFLTRALEAAVSLGAGQSPPNFLINLAQSIEG